MVAKSGLGEFQQRANWSGSTVPTGTATFGTSTITSLSFSASTFVGSFAFNAGNYTFTVGNGLDFGRSNGAGIVINGGSAIINVNNGVQLGFNNTSTAGSATFNNSGTMVFLDETTGGTARFINQANGVIDLSGLDVPSMTAGSIEGAGRIFLGSNNLTVGGNNLSTTFSGALQDGGIFPDTGGSLTKTGTGTLTLTGTNTYTGGTTISSGTLVLGNGGTSGSIVGNVNNNGILAVNRSDILTLAGVISGSGAFQQLGSGTTILTGTNTYTGATTINGGTLALSGTGSIAASSGVNVANAAGVFDISATTAGATITTLSGVANSSVRLGGRPLTLSNASGTFNGVISGAGGALVLSAGTETLTGANTYTGGTTVSGGTLVIGNNNALGSGGLSLAAGTTLSFLGTANFTVANNIKLSGDPMVTTPAGTLQTLSGVISDGTSPGTLEKTGAGTLVLTGANTYTGTTAVNAGTLIVDGSIASSATTVNNGGTLAGTGTVGSVTVANGGTFAPGPLNAPGTIAVNGNLAFQPGAFYLVQVNPSTASRANVSGTATLTGGTVEALFAPGSYIPRQYTILHSGGLGGTTFSGLSVSGNVPANFMETLSYTPTDVLLDLNAALGAGVALNQNQRNVATAINGFFNAGGALPPAFVNLFGLTGGNLANALTQLSGEPATGAQQGAFQLMTGFLGIMTDPFVDGRRGIVGGPALRFASEADVPPDSAALAYARVTKAPVFTAPAPFVPYWAPWGGAYGSYNRTGGDPAGVGSHDLSAHTGGFTAGLDYHLAPYTVVGFALAGGGTNWGLAQGLGGGKSDAFQAGAYGATQWGPAYLAASLAFANHWMSTDRVAAFADHLTANFDAQSFGGRIEAGYNLVTPIGGVAPYAAVQVQSFHTPAYAEADVSGGGFGLDFDARTATDTRSELGGRFNYVAAAGPDAILTLRGRLAWAHDWVSNPSLTALFQTLPGASFVVNGAAPARDSALATAGAEFRFASGLSFLANFNGEFASHSSTYGGTGIVRYTW
jgi:autotransporter-associated beta strand protein